MPVQAAAPSKPTRVRAQSEGYGTLGEFLQDVAEATRSEKSALPYPARMNALISGLGEKVPADGGFLVQPDLSQDLLLRLYQTGQIASRVMRVTLTKPGANGLKFNGADEDSRVDGSRWGGLQAYWGDEAGNVSSTLPKVRQIELILQKLFALCYATSELVEDAGALGALMERGFREEILFKLEDAIVNGDGIGKPLGILNSGAALQVAKDGGDSGATISTNDVLALWKHLYPPSRQEAVWLINCEIEEVLYPLTFGSGSGTQLLYTPPGQNGNQFGLLLGRPVIPVEHCPVLGTPGDIILADLSQYCVVDRGTPASNHSIHVRYLSFEDAFRWTYRVDGTPGWKKPLTPKNGSNLQAPFTYLAARS